MAHGDIYRLDLPEACGAGEFDALVNAIDSMIEDRGERPPNLLPAVTAIDRNEASELRTTLLQDRMIAKTMAAVESALGIATIDEHPHDSTGVAFQRPLMIGNGFDRWFGKTTFSVSARQWIGVQLDHTLFNGELGQTFMELLLATCRALYQGRVRSGGSGRKESTPFHRLPSPPMKWENLRRILAAYRSSGQVENNFTIYGSMLSLPKATQSEITEYATLAGQLVMAKHRGAMPETVVPVRHLGSQAKGMNYIRASFESVAQLPAFWRAHRQLDPTLLAKAISDWRLWFRRGLVGGLRRTLLLPLD